MNELEENVILLSNLAVKGSLSKAELTQARKAMRVLKQMGMSNTEIFRICQGAWSESTIKSYTKGIKANNPSPWQDAMGLLNTVISSEIDLDDIQTALNVKHDLDNMGVKLDDVSDLIIEADSLPFDLEILVSQSKELHDAGLSVKQLVVLANSKKQLEENGLNLNSLAPLANLMQTHIAPENLLEAVLSYGTLTELKDKTTEIANQLQATKNEISSISTEKDHAEAELNKIKAELSQYGAIKTLGFTNSILKYLNKLASKYGDVSSLVKAFNLYDSYADILQKKDVVEHELKVITSKISNQEAKHSHIKAAIDMCQTLIHKHNLGLEAIATILSIAQKYGNTINVLKAIEAYSKLQALQKDTLALEGRIAKQQELLTNLEGEFKQAMDSFDVINEKAMAVSNTVGRLEGQAKSSEVITKALQLMGNPASPAFSEFGSIVLLMATSIQKFVIANESILKDPIVIKTGLAKLIANVGGIA